MEDKHMTFPRSGEYMNWTHMGKERYGEKSSTHLLHFL